MAVSSSWILIVNCGVTAKTAAPDLVDKPLRKKRKSTKTSADVVEFSDRVPSRCGKGGHLLAQGPAQQGHA